MVVDALRAGLRARGIEVPEQWLDAVAGAVTAGHRYIVNVETAESAHPGETIGEEEPGGPVLEASRARASAAAWERCGDSLERPGRRPDADGTEAATSRPTQQRPSGSARSAVAARRVALLTAAATHAGWATAGTLRPHVYGFALGPAVSRGSRIRLIAAGDAVAAAALLRASARRHPLRKALLLGAACDLARALALATLFPDAPPRARRSMIVGSLGGAACSVALAALAAPQGHGTGPSRSAGTPCHGRHGRADERDAGGIGAGSAEGAGVTSARR